MNKGNPLDAVLEAAMERAARFRDDLRFYLEGRELGVQTATPEEEDAYVQMKIRQHPPDLWEHEDGRVEYNSPWVIALREGWVEDPKGAWRGVKSALLRLGPLPVPKPQPVETSAPPAAAPPMMGGMPDVLPMA